MRLAGTTTEEVSSTSTRVLKEEEERAVRKHSSCDDGRDLELG
jgi:hypothetical protein